MKTKTKLHFIISSRGQLKPLTYCLLLWQSPHDKLFNIMCVHKIHNSFLNFVSFNHNGACFNLKNKRCCFYNSIDNAVYMGKMIFPRLQVFDALAWRDTKHIQCYLKKHVVIETRSTLFCYDCILQAVYTFLNLGNE